MKKVGFAKMKKSMQLILCVTCLQIIPIHALFRHWRIVLQGQAQQRIFLFIAAGLIVLSIIAGVVISFIKTKARPLKEGDAKLLEILLLSWVPTAGLVYHSMFTHAEMRTEFRMYILLYGFVIIGCCLGLIRQKNELQRTGKND